MLNSVALTLNDSLKQGCTTYSPLHNLKKLFKPTIVKTTAEHTVQPFCY